MTNGSGSNPDANEGGATDSSGEGSTDTDNTGNNATDGKNSNYSKINRRKGNRTRQVLISNPTIYTTNKAFEGSEPDIGFVLGMRFEKVDKKVAYNVFCNKFSNYIGRNMNNGNEVVYVVKESKDSMTDYEENNIPRYLTSGETSEARKAIIDQTFKLYVTKEA